MTSQKYISISALLTAVLITPVCPQDTSYGTAGFVHTDFDGFFTSIANDVAIQPPLNKVIVAGEAGQFGKAFALVRYSSNGILDGTFGTGGRVITKFQDNARASDIELQANGQIVAAGTTSGPGPVSIALARYNSNFGTLDTSFGAGGKVVNLIGGGGGRINSMKIQSDGKIIVAGTGFSSLTGFDYFLRRFLSNGQVDTTFGLQGTVITNFVGDEEVHDLAIQSDGKIVAVGAHESVGNNGFFAIARYNPNGTLDTTFNRTGKRLTDFQTEANAILNLQGDYAFAVAIQGDGKIVVGGQTLNDFGLARHDVALVRYTATGSLDTTFGPLRNGKATFAHDPAKRDNDLAIAVMVQPDGKMFVASQISGLNFRWGLAKVSASGASFDTTFGNSGKIITDSRGVFPRAIALQLFFSNGRFIVAGDGDPVQGGSGETIVTTAAFPGFPRTLLNTGAFDLAPSDATIERSTRLNYALTWTVPGASSWHDLRTLELRIRDDCGAVLQLRFDEATNTFSVLKANGKYGHPGSPGSSGRLQGHGAALVLDESSVVGTGPEGPTVTLNVALDFKPSAAGRSYVVEVAASDDLGASDPFTEAGILTINP